MPTATVPRALNGAISVSPAAPVPSPTDITAEVMRITPAMAAELLANRLPNRPLNRKQVTAMARDMAAGRFLCNGEPIILTAEMQLIDGQNRLSAIVESGCAGAMLVVVGVAPEAMVSIDQGRSRSLSDALATANTVERRPRDVVSAARWVWRLEHQAMRSQTIPLGNMTIADFVAQHPGLAEALTPGRQLRHLLPQSLGTALYYTFSHFDQPLAEQYYRDLRQGSGLEEGAPALSARERCLRERTTHVSHAQAVARAAVLALCWNCLRAQKDCPQGVAWKGERDTAVPFPKII